MNAHGPRTYTWPTLPDLPHGVNGTAAVTEDDAPYVFSGAALQGVYGFAHAYMLRPV